MGIRYFFLCLAPIKYFRPNVELMAMKEVHSRFYLGNNSLEFFLSDI